jgi:hypothetical protein
VGRQAYVSAKYIRLWSVGFVMKTTFLKVWPYYFYFTFVFWTEQERNAIKKGSCCPLITFPVHPSGCQNVGTNFTSQKKVLLHNHVSVFVFVCVCVRACVFVCTCNRPTFFHIFALKERKWDCVCTYTHVWKYSCGFCLWRWNRVH